MCLLAALCLEADLRNAQLKSQRVYGKLEKDGYGFPLAKSHCWVECCGYVVDVTATQFGYRNKVKIFKINRKLANGYHNL